MKLCAFADEISPDLPEQIRVCRETGVTHVELRSVEKINVLDFDPAMRRKVRDTLAAGGLGVACIGSPIGKVKITDPWPEHFERFKRAVELADYFSAPLIRIFSYYPPENGNMSEDQYRQEVLNRISAKVEFLGKSPVTLVLENEMNVYGEKGRRCLDLLATIDSPRFRAAFDFANFVQAGENPLDNWPMLKPYSVHIHIKDAQASDRKVVPPGHGDGKLAEILGDLNRSGYQGFLSLEPHLKAAGKLGGFSGPELFKVAADALKSICRQQAITLDLGKT